jgi:hypothetical protein
LAWTQQGFGQYHYQYQPPVSGDGQYSGHHWRPIEDRYPYQAEEIQTFRNGSEVISNPSQPLMAFPPATYRPMDQNDRMAPQVGAYRFRTLTPDEKSRIKKLDQQRNMDNQDRVQPRFQFRGHESPALMWSPSASYFRPDDRFTENESAQTYPYHPHQSQYSQNPSYWAPLFRPDNLDR